jgi:hypothetical protein
MRRILVLAGACVVGALVSVTGAQAAVITNTSTPLDLSVFVPCANGGAGEIVDLSGQLHTVISTTINGNNFSAKEHFQPQGVSGTGETTGAKYQGTGVTQTQQAAASSTARPSKRSSTASTSSAKDQATTTALTKPPT